MPLLGTAISHRYCFHFNKFSCRPVIHDHGKIVVGNNGGLRLASAFSRKPFCITEKLGKKFNLGHVERWPRRQTIKAVATLETTSYTCKNEVTKGSILRDIDSRMVELQSSSQDAAELDEAEKLRRKRISQANKGMTAWNKGRKHSAETIRRIKERTKIAMQDPKIRMRMKQINLGNVQTEETKMKIGAGVRLGWERRRCKLKLQETWHYEWQNLIAEAARKGLLDEDELNWDSYDTLNKQLKKEYLQSVQTRKNTPRTKAKKRVPKSAEQRRKISEAISAKWTDPEYRNRVFFGLAKYHGILDRVGRKPRKKPGGNGHVKRSPTRKDEIVDLENLKIMSQVKLKSKEPPYEDPLANSKLDMLKKIRAQRAAVVSKKTEAVSRAKWLVAKAEAAATALETAAYTSRHAQAALVESRTLIAKANQFLESIENEDLVPFANNSHPSLYLSTKPEDEEDPNNAVMENGIKVNDYRFSEFFLPDCTPISCRALESNDRVEVDGAIRETRTVRNGLEGGLWKLWKKLRLSLVFYCVRFIATGLFKVSFGLFVL